ncbi:glycosyltransferase family A protein [Flavobacterium sp. GP15]|uniref:glycosyltransferase family 2 protein n=1 Tax=Flavobacterium sp. GP15 TaxID=2758567 RepID=UPI00165E2916|nr:glycosyltransferase family A protein [Flavobacterium sp. GP15]
MNLVSIIIPIYNQEKYLKETLNSVVNQTYSNWECILINDGSSDNSVSVLSEYVSKDNRFVFINSENKGVSSARNFGLKRAKGYFILFLDGDDLIHPDKVNLAISSFQKNINLDIVFNCTNYFQNTVDNTLYPITLNSNLLNFNDLLLFWGDKIIIPIHSAIIKKDLFDGIEYNCDLTAQEDWLVWLRLFQKNPKILVLDNVLSYYRKHNKSRTQSCSFEEDHFKAMEIFEKYMDLESYKSLMLHQTKRYYKRAYDNANKLNEIKRSKTFRTALFVKSKLKKFRLLSVISFLSANFFKDEK